MDKGALINFIVIAGIVWGGFIFMLIYAVIKERAKKSDQPDKVPHDFS